VVGKEKQKHIEGNTCRIGREEGSWEGTRQFISFSECPPLMQWFPKSNLIVIGKGRSSEKVNLLGISPMKSRWFFEDKRSIVLVSAREK
jgi:hypothetical protein